ncbi:MAG TPA: hypothetical protein VMZ71_11670, partial [Gemmataceae bacterium]|nr:hypothetical protein [Gemmataceae bacterium]
MGRARGHIPKSPVRGVEKPPDRRREQVFTPAEFAALLSRVPEPCFRDVLEFCWESGCRVQEVRAIEARHLRLDRDHVELSPAETKGKKRGWFIYLKGRAAEIVRTLAARRPVGPVFRNAGGRPWDAQNFNNRFCRLQLRLGREELARRGFALPADRVAALAATLDPVKRVRGRPTPKAERELLREARKKLTAGGEGARHQVRADRDPAKLREAAAGHLGALDKPPRLERRQGGGHARKVRLVW